MRMVIPVQEGMKPIEECNEICKRYGLEIIEASYTVATCIENIPDSLPVLFQNNFSAILLVLFEQSTQNTLPP